MQRDGQLPNESDIGLISERNCGGWGNHISIWPVDIDIGKPGLTPSRQTTPEHVETSSIRDMILSSPK
jgi:hypothetical protein